jgi:hypothetical protein
VKTERRMRGWTAHLHGIGGWCVLTSFFQPVTGYDCRSDYPRLVERLRSLSGEGLPAAVIHERLYGEGFRPRLVTFSIDPGTSRQRTWPWKFLAFSLRRRMQVGSLAKGNIDSSATRGVPLPGFLVNGRLP